MGATRDDEIHIIPAFYLGKLLIDMGDFRRAEQFLLDLLRDSAILSQPRRIVRVHKGLAGTYAYNKEYQKTVYHYQEALRVSLTYLSDDHPELVPIYKAIGDNYFKQNDYNHSLENYEKAIELIEHNSSQFNNETITDLQNCINKTKQMIQNPE